eukprot:g434.t1
MDTEEATNALLEQFVEKLDTATTAASLPQSSARSEETEKDQRKQELATKVKQATAEELFDEASTLLSHLKEKERRLNLMEEGLVLRHRNLVKSEDACQKTLQNLARDVEQRVEAEFHEKLSHVQGIIERLTGERDLIRKAFQTKAHVNDYVHELEEKVQQALSISESMKTKCRAATRRKDKTVKELKATREQMKAQAQQNRESQKLIREMEEKTKVFMQKAAESRRRERSLTHRLAGVQGQLKVAKQRQSDLSKQVETLKKTLNNERKANRELRRNQERLESFTRPMENFLVSVPEEKEKEKGSKIPKKANESPKKLEGKGTITSLEEMVLTAPTTKIDTTSEEKEKSSVVQKSPKKRSTHIAEEAKIITAFIDMLLLTYGEKNRKIMATPWQSREMKALGNLLPCLTARLRTVNFHRFADEERENILRFLWFCLHKPCVGETYFGQTLRYTAGTQIADFLADQTNMLSVIEIGKKNTAQLQRDGGSSAVRQQILSAFLVYSGSSRLKRKIEALHSMDFALAHSNVSYENMGAKDACRTFISLQGIELLQPLLKSQDHNVHEILCMIFLKLIQECICQPGAGSQTEASQMSAPLSIESTKRKNPKQGLLFNKCSSSDFFTSCTHLFKSIATHTSTTTGILRSVQVSTAAVIALLLQNMSKFREFQGKLKSNSNLVESIRLTISRTDHRRRKDKVTPEKKTATNDESSNEEDLAFLRLNLQALLRNINE